MPLPFLVRLTAVGLALLLVSRSGSAAVTKSGAPEPGVSAVASVPHLTYEEIRVLSLSTADQRAVIQLPAGDQRVLALGDEVPEVGARVVQVLRDRLVLRERRDSQGRTAAGRQVWIYRYSGTGPSRVQILNRSIPQASGQRPPAQEAPRQKPPGR